MITDKTKILKGLVALALSSADSDVKQILFREVEYDFRRELANDGVGVTMIQAAPIFGDEDSATECRSYLEFKADGQSVVVAIEGYFSSYGGYQYNQWYFCKPTPVTKVEYVKE